MEPIAFRTASVLRACHDEYARTESARRAGAASESARGGAATRTSEVQWIPWGESAEVVGAYDSVETEYAAIRAGAALCDLPQRGTIEITGAGRLDFLQRMLTQDVKGCVAGTTAEAFWLNRKGRIDADLLLGERGDRLFVDCAESVVASTASALAAFVFSEDVVIENATARTYRLALHGPQAIDLLSRVGTEPEAIAAISVPSACADATLASHRCLLVRRDLCGEIGIEIIVARDAAASLWGALLSVHDLTGGGRRRAKPCGWFAFNMARIEGGSPLFEIDFGTSSLPHETGLIARRVSFTKGCYLGQEIVARMQSLGKPKQVIRAFRMAADSLPTEGAQVFPKDSLGEAIGQVTSSSASPMLGAACIGFATIRWAFSAAGSEVQIVAEGEPRKATLAAELGVLDGSTRGPQGIE